MSKTRPTHENIGMESTVKSAVTTASEMNIAIYNVVCSFDVGCHLNLYQIAHSGIHVEFREKRAVVLMKLKKPYSTATIWSSGRVVCVGTRSEQLAKMAARRFARKIQRLGYPSTFKNFKVVNVFGTCYFPFGIKITEVLKTHNDACYEPELQPGLSFKMADPRVHLKVFSTGSVTVTAPSVAAVQAAVSEVYPTVLKYRHERSAQTLPGDKQQRVKREQRQRRVDIPVQRQTPARDKNKRCQKKRQLKKKTSKEPKT